MTGFLTGAVATMLINAVIIVLLAVTIGYCWLLNRRIKVLQDSRGELARLLQHFDESTQRASESIIGLQTASRRIGDTIQQRMDKASDVLDDLSFMIEKAHKLANQMEAGFAVGRAQQRVSAEQPRARAAVPPPPPPETVETVADESPVMPPSAGGAAFPRYELTGDMAVMPRDAANEDALRQAAREVVRNPNALEQALTRVMSRNRDLQAQEEARPQRQVSGRVRSRSEQELLDMIRAGFKG